MMKYLSELGLSPGSDIPALNQIMVQMQEHRRRTVGASIDKVSRTTALLSAGLLNSNIRSAMEEAGLIWDKFSEQNGARDFAFREIASETIPDPDLHDNLRSALKAYGTLLRGRPVDAAGLTYAILNTLEPEGRGLPSRLRKSTKARSLEDFLATATEALARAFPDLAQFQPPPEPPPESEFRVEPESPDSQIQSEAADTPIETGKGKVRKEKASRKATKRKATKKKKAAKEKATAPDPDQVPDQDRDREDLPETPAPPVDSFQPLPRVARDYWTTEDHLGLGDYAEAVAAFLRHEETRPPLTIGIKAPWGAGKTSLMRMIQLRLDPPDDPMAARWEFKKLSLTKQARELLQATEESSHGKDGDVKEESSHRKDGDVEMSQSVYGVLRRLDRAPEERPNFAGIGKATETSTEKKKNKPTKKFIKKPTEKPAEKPIKDAGSWRATVWFNPWMYQSGEEVWAGFVHEIVQQVTGRLEDVDRERFWFELNLRRLDRQAIRRKIYKVAFERILPTALVLALVLAVVLFLALGGASLLENPPSWATSPTGGLWATGVVWATAVVVKLVSFLRGDASTAVDSLLKSPSFGGSADTLRKQFEGTLDDILPEFDYASKTGFLHLVQNDIRHVLDLVATKDRPLVIFVDDLDRCSPGVVAQTIEAINLFLAGEFPNCIFVLAVEPAVVAAHVEVAHEKLVERLKTAAVGSDWSTLGWRFLEKIVQLPLSLPRADTGQTREYLASLFGSGQEKADDSTRKKARERIDASIEKSTLKAQQTLKARNVTLESLPELLKEEQDFVVDAGITPEEATEVRDKVAAALFTQFYKDSDPVVQSIVTEEALKLPSRNAREIKRLLNLFRFYSFIAARRRLLNLETGTSQRATLEVVARLCVFLIRWPFLLSAVSRRADEGNPQTSDDDSERVPIQLEVLERAANEDDETWQQALVSIGLATEVRQQDGTVAVKMHECESELREYLRGSPRVGEFARGLL